MGHYRSNLRDIEFNLFEVLDRKQVLGSTPYAELDPDTARSVLQEVDRLAREELADSFTEADREPPRFDPASSSVRLPACLHKSFGALMDAEWYRLELPEELGGIGAPPSLRWAAAELLLGSNPAAYMYASGPLFGYVIHRLGTPEQQTLARQMIERKWGGTMVLTEPDAGSDVGAGRTSATRQPDGSWHLHGVKRFITGGEWDWPENIVHQVLARPEGHGPGTKGLSLFVVPKFLVRADGSLGERNGVFATNLERKMGLKASATCELRFGEKHPAVGYLLGDVHDGIRQMFQVIQYARMMVGTKAIATLSTGYLNALEYAKTRLQGPDLTAMTDRAAPRVAIIQHPDVRRMLMMQKAYAEGLRALVLYTATQQDAAEIAAAEGTEDEAAAGLNELLLPIVKGVGSERSYELLGSTLQVFGGSGYLQDYPIEQYIRDAKIDTLYEGTTGIQGMDLFFRKIVRDKGQALTRLLTEIRQLVDRATPADELAAERAALGRALEDVQAMVGAMVGFLTGSAEEPRNLHRVGLNTTRLLLSLGDLVIGWLLLRQAEVAGAKLAEVTTERDRSFYRGKVASARFFAAARLPLLACERAMAEATTLQVMDLEEAGF
jgi:alkylation response protein AidB-like acyl-CoA dehydrogenase